MKTFGLLPGAKEEFSLVEVEVLMISGRDRSQCRIQRTSSQQMTWTFLDFWICKRLKLVAWMVPSALDLLVTRQRGRSCMYPMLIFCLLLGVSNSKVEQSLATFLKKTGSTWVNNCLLTCHHPSVFSKSYLWTVHGAGNGTGQWYWSTDSENVGSVKFLW